MSVVLFCPPPHSPANWIYETLKDLDVDYIVLDYLDDYIDEVRWNWKRTMARIFKSMNIFEWGENINLLLPHELVILNKYDFTPPKKHLFIYPRINMLIFDAFQTHFVEAILL